MISNSSHHLEGLLFNIIGSNSLI